VRLPALRCAVRLDERSGHFHIIDPAGLRCSNTMLEVD